MTGEAISRLLYVLPQKNCGGGVGDGVIAANKLLPRVLVTTELRVLQKKQSMCLQNKIRIDNSCTVFVLHQHSETFLSGISDKAMMNLLRKLKIENK